MDTIKKFEKDGELMATGENAQPREFKNVGIYTSGPWGSVVPGYVRNVYIKGKFQLNTIGTCVSGVFFNKRNDLF